MAATSKHESKWRAELNRLKAAVAAAEESVRESEGEVRARKAKLRAIREVHFATLDAWLRGDDDLPPRQAELFGDDQVEEIDAVGRRIAPPPGEWTDRDHEEFEELLQDEFARKADKNAVEGGTREPREGEDDFHRELRAALHTVEGASERWAGAIARGESDAALKELIGREFGLEGSSSGPARKGHRYAGGKNPRFWFGAAWGNPKPDLSGAALVKAVRDLLGIPQPRPTIKLDDQAGGPAPTGPRPKIEVDLDGDVPPLPTAFTGAQLDAEIEAACLPPHRALRWQDFRDVGATDAEILDHLGELWAGEPGSAMFARDAPDMVGRSTSAPDGKSPRFWMGARSSRIAKAHFEGGDLALLVRRVMRIPQPKPAPSVVECGLSGYEQDEALDDAVYPDFVETDWRDLQIHGASDDEVLAELVKIWPAERMYHERPGAPNYTTQGGESPRFWFGSSLDNGKPRPADLSGPSLIAAVRRVRSLHTPEELDARLGQPQPKAKKAAKPKKSEAVR